MRRSAQLVAAVAMLVVFAAAPALAAACAARCVDAHPSAATAAVPACHETSGDGPRLEGDAADPCATHELAAAEAATRTQPREEATPAPAVTTSPAPGPQLAARRASAVLPGAPRPGPSRPPLVLRL